MSERNSVIEHEIRTRLKGLHVHLQVVHAGLVVAAAALHYQNAQRDEEIARVLEYAIGDRLSEQIERTAELLAFVQPLPTHPDHLDSWDP